MTHEEIKKFLESFANKKQRTIVIVDFANVDKWDKNLGWKVGIQELAKLVKYFTFGTQPLRRFYYGSDYGPNERSQTLTFWSKGIIERANWNRFEVITKRVKFIHNAENPTGYDKKCDFDVEMTVDLIKMRDEYDDIVLFSGDGDLVCALKYLHDEFGKKAYVFGARGHVGREVVDANVAGIIEQVCYAEDFQYRLEMNRKRA